MDHPVLSGTTYRTTAFDNWQGLSLSRILEQLKEVAIDTNREWAKKLGINPSTAITAIKPSGTVSQLVDSSSGIHARHSRYYIRTVRNDVKDPLSLAMVAMGVPHEVDAMNPQSLVFSFPIKAPESAVTRSDMTALEQLNLWLIYQQNWCEHKPSVTVSVGEDEWTDVQAWVYKHYDEVSGISFLPRSDHTYRQAPYQECTEEEYSKFLEKMPKEFDWSILKEFESRDMTIGSQELACTGGSCEI
jgi:ribonucleoside-diphosphate reductase alpha chain